MANAVRLRVELKKKYNDDYKNFKEMFYEFKKRVNQSGILHEYKEHQTFMSDSRKARLKRRESDKERLLERITENLRKGEKIDAPIGLIKKVQSDMKKKRKNPSDSLET